MTRTTICILALTVGGDQRERDRAKALKKEQDKAKGSKGQSAKEREQ
jgi:hypothetical protein